MREWVEDDIIKIIFVPTLENTADIFTKNPTEEIFATHATKLVKNVPNNGEKKNAETCILAVSQMRVQPRK